MRRGLLLLALLALAACDAAETPTSPPAPPADPVREIVDGNTYGATGFYFRLWSSPAPIDTGTFDNGLQPVVEICRVTSGNCGPVLATFQRTSGSYGRLVTVNNTSGQYEVTWPTGSTGVGAGQVYRIRVRVGSRVLGYNDVQFVTSLWQFLTVDYSQFVPWVAGWDLDVAFRIETNVVGSIVLSASSVNVGVGSQVPLTATVRDLRNQPMPVQANWYIQNSSSAPNGVVVVDSGWAIGQYAGTGTITAWYDDLEVTIPATVTDTRRAWNGVGTPDDQGIRALWGSGTTPTFAAGHTGMLRHNGVAWAYVDDVRWRSMHDVFGFGASNVWGVGEDGVILRFDGAGWTAQRYDGTSVSAMALDDWSVPAQKVILRGVWGNAATNVFVAGDNGTLLRWNGTAWSTLATGTTANLTSVWGTSATNVYVSTSDGRVLRWNGTSVAPLAGLTAPGALWGVWASSTSDVYTVGDGGLLYRYNGSTWTRTRLPTRAALYDVWGSGSNNVFVGGESGALYRFNGSTWTPERSAGGTTQILDLWGTATTTFASGAGGLITSR